MTGLNPKQKKFVEEYLVCGDGKEAAIRAGYSPKSAAGQASRLLAMPAVQKYRMERETELFEEMGISQAWIGRRLVEIVERCMQKTPVLEWDDKLRKKVESGQWQFDTAGATKALHELFVQLGYSEGKEAEQNTVKLIILGENTEGLDE